MGKGGYVRVQNKSTLEVEVTIEERREVENDGVEEMQGTLAPGEQLPKEGGHVGENSGRYQYMEGEKKVFLQKNGSFNFVVTADGSSSSLKICVDNRKWWVEETEQPEDAVTKVVASVQDVGDQDQIDVVIYNAYHASSWMGELESDIADTPLCQVCLPGTHDSATYDFDEDKGASPDSDLTMAIQDKLTDSDDEDEEEKGFFKKMGNAIGSAISDGVLGVVYDRMCKAQSLSIKEQLEAGIRYLDLRMAYHEDSGQYYSCHGVYCINIKTILGEINDFLIANPKEIVILDFNHLYKMDGHHEGLVDDLLSTLGDRAADLASGLRPSSTVQEYWDANAQAVLIYQHRPTANASGGKIWPIDCIASPWPNTNDVDVLQTKLKENVEKRDTEKFFVLQGLLTPDGDLIKEEIMTNKTSTSLASIAKRTSPKVVEWVDEWKGEKHNVVIVDFFQDCSMVPLVINMNRK